MDGEAAKGGASEQAPFGACDKGKPQPFHHKAMERAPEYDALLVRSTAASATAHAMDQSDRQDPNCLHDAGWGVIFPSGMAGSTLEDLKQRLKPLLDWRHAEIYPREKKCGKALWTPQEEQNLFRIFEGSNGYRSDRSAAEWLGKHGVDLGQVDPGNGVPYYLMIVGSPKDIPWDFQTDLDAQWGVGRIWFEDKEGRPDFEAFERYAESVKCYEDRENPVSTRKYAAVYATRLEGDPATGSLMNDFIVPLRRKSKLGVIQDFPVRWFLGGDAGKDTPGASREVLGAIMNGTLDEGPPALLFTGSHGRFPDYKTNPEYHDLLGALIAQEWDGSAPPPDEVVFAARDLKDHARIHGMIHFMFACFGIGSPQNDSYSESGEQIAPDAVLAQLPQRMLSHSAKGALAVLGHVDRAFPTCWLTEEETPQVTYFRSVLAGLMNGDRIGLATDQFNSVWATRHTQIEKDGTKEQKAQRWLRTRDARAFAVFGDPAVRLRVEDMKPSGATP